MMILSRQIKSSKLANQFIIEMSCGATCYQNVIVKELKFFHLVLILVEDTCEAQA